MKDPKDEIKDYVITRISMSLLRKGYEDKYDQSYFNDYLYYLGCDVEKYKCYIEDNFKEGMTWENYDTFWRMSFIKPIHKFYLIHENERRKFRNYTNTMPLTISEIEKKEQDYKKEKTHQTFWEMNFIKRSKWHKIYEIENVGLDDLRLELTLVESISTRRSIVYYDLKNKKHRYKVLADNDPSLFFDLLGGDVSNANRRNWAYEYTYEDYIENSGEQYDKNDAKLWDTEQESIDRAHDTGDWYVTGIIVLEGSDGEKLPFEIRYSEGYFDGIIGNPYDTSEEGSTHGILIY